MIKIRRKTFYIIFIPAIILCGFYKPCIELLPTENGLRETLIDYQTVAYITIGAISLIIFYIIEGNYLRGK